MSQNENLEGAAPKNDQPEPQAVLAWISMPLVEGRGTERSMLLGRALMHRHARDADFVVITGGLTARGQMDEREAFEASLKRRSALCVPGKTDSEMPGGPRPVCAMAAGFNADASWPLECSCCDGRLVLFGLDLPKGQIEQEELEALDKALERCDEKTRKVIVASEDWLDAPLIVVGKKRHEEAKIAADLKTICRERKVDLFLYAGVKAFESRKLGEMTVLGHPSSMLGVGLSGQRFFTELRIGLDSGSIAWEPVYYAPPARQRRFDESFANAADIETAVSVVEKAAESEAKHEAFQVAMEQQSARLKRHDQINRALDGELFELMSRELKK